eukprot:gene3223-3435_t
MEAHTFHLMSAKFQRVDASSREISSLVIQAIPTLPATSFLMEVCTDQIVKVLQDDKTLKFDSIVDENVPGLVAVVEYGEAFSLINALNIALWCQKNGATLILIQLPDPEYFNSFLETIITKILPKTKTKTKAKAKPAEKIIPVISKDHVSFDWSQLIVPTFFIPNQSVKQLLDDFRRNSSLIRFKITAFRASYRNGLAVPKILLSSLIEEMINHKNGDLSIEMLDELQGYLIQENVEHNLPQSFDFIKEKINHRTFPLGIALLNIIIRCAKSSRDQLTALRHLIVHFTRNLSWLSDAVHIAQEPVLKDIVIQLLVECLHNQESIQFPDVSQDCEWMIPLWCFLVESGVLSEPNRAIEWQNILSIAFAEGNLAVFCGVFKSAKDMKSQCITEREVNDSLKAFSQLSFPSFDDLKLILSIGNVEDELESPFKAIIKRMIDHSVVSPDFNQLMRLLLHLKTLPEQFKDLSMQIITDIIPTLVFKMNSAEMRKWIKEGYAFIPRPSQMEWEDYLREASRDHTLLLQEILVILESLIEFNLTSPDVVIDLVTIYTDNHQILDAYQTFLEIASTDMMQKHWDSIKDAVFGKLSLKTFMISGQQFLKFSQSVAKGRWLDQAKVIADYIIGKFINHVFKPINQNDCTCDIFTYHDLLSYSSDKEFMGKVFQFCFRQFKIIDIFEDYPTLLGFLSSLSNAHDSIVISMLRLLQNSRLNFIPPETVQALKEIKEKYQELCDHQRLKLVDWKSLESILSNDRRVETLEKALQSGGKLLEAIRLTIVKIRSINKFIESQKPFLAHLKCFFPGTVRDIEERSQINLPIEEKHHLSLQTWSTRETEIVDFINQYHKEDIDFFQHFSSLESSQASNSVLFGFFMKKHAAEKDDEVLNSRNVIRAVRDDLMKLCSIRNSYQRGKKMNMEQLLEISKELQLADRKPEREFNIICSYLYKDSTSSQRVNMIREKITKILDLVVLREALIPFFLGERNESGVALPRLEFLKFLCADPNKDGDYMNLLQLLQNMENSKVMEKWDAEKCQEMLSALLNCFADDVNHHQVLGILNLINNAAQCTKVWEFFLQRPDFISPEGLGYSNSLNDKLEDFLTELGGEDAKIVNNFCTVGHWVAILIHHLQTPFKQLIQSLLESTKIRNQLDSTSDTQRFSQLLLANEHMDYIGDLMQYGLSSLDIVLSQLKSIQLFCIYHFDAETVELTLEYYDVKRNQTVILSKDELQDFQQRLEFVQREKNALTYDVPAFVGQLDAFRKKILLLHELFLLGHPKYNSKLYSLRCGGPKTRSRSKFTGTDLKLKELENLETELRMWEDKLNHVMKENPLMTLFTKEQAKNIAQVKSQHHLIYSLAHLFDESSRSVKKTIEKCLQAAQRLQISHDWVATFSAIINCLTFSANLRKELLLSAAAINDYQNCTRFICTSNGNSLMKCLTKVFARSSVPPMAVQLLWCYFNVTSNDLKEFLNRALSFPQMNFTLVRFDLLSLSQQQMVLKFMLEHQELKNLHCIENGNGILQSASWMPVINAEDHLGDFDYLSKIKDWTKSNQNNLCFHGPAGSGKTFHLRKWMHQSRAKGFVPHLISITEQFDWKRILQSIYNAFVSGEKVLLAFQINIGKFRDNDGEIKQWKRLVESINVLFFHLLVIRGFSFLNSEIIFNIPLTANCLIGLEFPDLAAHVEGPIGREDLFSFISREVPVVSTIFQLQDASSFALELSPEAIHHTQAFVHIVGISAFYGFGKNQTIESVILSVLIELKSVDHIIQLIQQNLYKISFQEAVQKDANITATELRELQQKNLTMQLLENSSTLKGSREEKILEVLVTQSLLHYTIDMLLRIAIPENILSKWSEFPVSVLNMLLVERKFFLNLKDISEDARKRIVITRTTPNIIRMQTQGEGFSIISFTKFNKETHFEELLKSLSLDRMDSCEINYHTIIFDLSQVQISQINFARSKVDELWEDLLKEKVALTFLLHTTNADLRAKHLYDVTFADDWHCSFVDGSISSDLSYSFLQVSYSTLNEIDGKALLSSALPHWLPDAMNAIRKTILSAITSNGNEDQFLLQVLNYHNYGRTVKDIVFERFIQLFFSEAGGDGSIFKAEVQRAVERYWRVSQNISLLDSVQLHIQSMFTKFLQFFVFSLLEDISTNQFQLENRLVLPQLVFDFLQKVEAPPIASLQTPLKLSMVLKLREEIGFPLFQSFYRMLEVMSNKILSSFNNCEDEDVWFQMINAFNTTLQQSQASDTTAHLFLKHCWLVDDESFLIYIDNYAAMLFKDLSTSSLQLQFVRNWLKNQVKFYSMNDEGRIALLHLQGQWYREMLFSFVSAIEPISVFAPSEEAKTSLFDLCAEGENAGEILHDAIIEFCYATLLECQELSLFQQIMQTYTFFLFESKKRRFSKRSQLKYEGIVTFFLISSTLTEGMLMDAAGYISIRNLVAEQVSAAERLGQSDISLPSLWKALPKATILKSAALTLLLQQRSERFTSSEIVWIINTLSTEEETFSDLNLAAIILDIALFSKPFSLKGNLPIIKSIIDWIKLVGSLISFDEQLRVNRTPGVPYVPHWFINQVPQKSFNRLADITFCLVWKWLMQLHSAASISELLALVHECEMSFESDRNVQNLVTVSLTAIRLYILHKWADCILQNRSAFNNELDKSRFLAQLDFVQPMSSWTEELAATLSSKAKQYKKNIVQYSLNKWKSSYCDGNKLILSWLNMIETRIQNTSENPLYLFQLKPYYSTKKIQSSSPVIEDSILSSFCRVVKGTTIGDLLKRSISQSYGNKYCKLWNKIKVGYRSYLKALDGSERCNSFELSDGLSLWELVSVNHATDSHEGMLFQILKQMVQSYGKVIDVSLSASMTHTSRPNASSLAMVTGVNIETIDRLLDEDSSMGIVEKALEGTLTHQESFNLVQRMVWLEYVLSRDVKFSHSFPLLSHYVNYVKSLAPVISISSLKIRYCNFANEANAQNNTDLTSIGKSQLIQFFHSLDYTEIIALTQSLTMLQNSAPIDSPQTSIGDLLLQLSLHDRSNDLTSFAERCLAVSDKDLLNFILSLSSGELPRLIGFLNLQIQSEIYIFANKPLELKKAWTEEVDEALKELEGEGLANIASVKDMESLLVKHEILLSKRPSESLVSTLAGVFQSDLTMFKQFPLLKKLSDVMIKCSYTLLCGHYVSLRLKLRQWANHSNKTKSNKSWDWSIESAVRSSASLENRNAVNFSYLNPWFLSSEDDDHEETSRQEINRYYERCVKKIQKWYKRNKSSRSVQRKVGEAVKSFQETDAKRTTEKGGRGGRAGRGRGRGQAQNKAIGIMANIAQEFQSYEPIINEIDSLLKDPNIRQQGKIDRLQTLLEEAIKMGASNTDGITLRSARALIAEFQERKQAALDSLDKILLHNPIEPEDLRRTLNGLLVLDVRDKKVDEAIKKLESILELKKKIAAALTTPPGLKRLKQLHNESVSLQLEEDRELVLLIEQLDRNDQLIRKRLSQRFNLPENISYNLSDANDAFDLQSTTTSTQSSMLQELLSKVNLQGGKSQQQKAIDTLLSKLEREPLSSFVHSKAILALGNSCPTHIDVFREDAEDFLANYFKIIQEKKHPTICSAVLLAVMRLTSSSKDVEFQVACLKHCDSPALRPWMSVTELALLSTNPSDATSPAAPSSSTIVGKPFANAVVDAATRWKDLQSLPDARPCSAINELMQMIGLNSVKQRVLDIYESIWMESKIPAASRVPRSYHFALLGNPGTGKTTVGKLLGKMLKELGIRSKNEFIDMTGEKLARMGADKAAQEINKAMDGVFFIDEAYALDPAKNVEGGAVAMQLLDVAESERERITLILAGYKNEIESKLFDYNDGFHRRFPHILVFDDYTDPELGQIFQSLCQQGNWKCSSDVVKLAARRVGRGRGHKTFGNAGAVRVCFERAYERALSRMKEQRNFKLEIVLEDVLGPPPTRENIPQLDRALEELDNVIGLETVKEKILNIVNLSLVNYHLELEGKEPRLISLNKVFLGNPGTGKTTVGKLYGRILRGLGFLSDGQCELKQPSDFLGSAVGETQKKTSALIARCKGKVLIIDEAYGLHGSSYGPEAVDTLVGLCHNSPGEDIAVIMIGYEKQIRRMFREMNPGLSSRFSLDDPFVFEDYNDDDLRRIAMKYVKDSGLTIPRETREALVKAISRQRFAPNFGNARTVVTMISRGKERISARDPRSTTLTLEDFGIESKKSSNPFELLQGMYKTDHIKQELIALQALLNQSERDGRDARQYLKNYIFIGNPGTGKSTVARLMATILFDFGLLGRNHVVTRSGLDLQGSYIGQTKDKVNEAMEEAQGGVLFIDEAYTLGGREGGGTVFAQEAVDQLVALLTTPEHLHNTVVILAGYPEAMEQMMQSSNEGLVSRCTGRMIFPNWDGRDCIEFLRQECDKENMTLEAAAINAFSKEFEDLSRRRDWANARDCVSTLKHLYQARALRGPRDFVYTIDDAKYAIAQLRLSRPVNAVVENSRGKPLGIVHTAIGNISSPVPAVQRKRAREEVKEEEASAEIEEIVMEVDDGTSNGDDLDPVYAALLIACREAGYDDSHERRCELVLLLEIVEQGGDFPTDIITIVIEKTKLPERAVTKILRPQVYRVLEGMRNAVRAEEELREELKRLEEEARKAKERELQQQREKLRRIGVCPMGYTWHRCGEGWRCAGGSHYVTDSQLMNMCTIE